jgi:hypothetical protein
MTSDMMIWPPRLLHRLMLAILYSCDLISSLKFTTCAAQRTQTSDELSLSASVLAHESSLQVRSCTASHREGHCMPRWHRATRKSSVNASFTPAGTALACARTSIGSREGSGVDSVLHLKVAASPAALAEEALAGGVHGHERDAGLSLSHHPLEASELLALCDAKCTVESTLPASASTLVYQQTRTALSCTSFHT